MQIKVYLYIRLFAHASNHTYHLRIDPSVLPSVHSLLHSSIYPTIHLSPVYISIISIIIHSHFHTPILLLRLSQICLQKSLIACLCDNCSSFFWSLSFFFLHNNISQNHPLCFCLSPGSSCCEPDMRITRTHYFSFQSDCDIH